MEERLKTTLLEYDKSTFLIDLVKHNSGNLYIEIEQIIHLDKEVNKTQKIKINPSLLGDIIETLTNFQKDIPPGITIHAKNYITNERQEEMIKRYFKGVGINSLAVQFDCTVNIIKQILTNRGIEIVSNEIQKVKKHWYGHKRRKQ